MKPANDNRAPTEGEKVVGSTLVNRAVIERHLTDGLQAVLKHSEVPPKVRKAVAEYMSPVLAILDRMESETIDYARKGPGIDPAKTIEVFSDVVTRLEGFAADFLGMARQNPNLQSLATSFGEFVNGLANAWELPMAQEFEEPDLER